MSDAHPESLLDEVRLASVAGVGPRLRCRLIEALGSAGRVLTAPDDELSRVPGIGGKLAVAIAQAPDRSTVVAMLRDAATRGVSPLTIEDERYPPRLKEIHDPPAVLYCRGAVLAQDERAVAIVGTRRATRYGLGQAERLATELARAGVTVVSGLARGIDGVAHRAALAAGGRTLAALAGGLNRIYPPEHTRLADDVAESGALLTEAPPPMPPMSGAFPQRNRIISGLSLGVVVIEAAERSGALITARHAAEQGRDAFAVPGLVDSVQSKGCHRLIQEGAKLVVSVDDILEELDSFSLAAPPPRRRPATSVTSAKQIAPGPVDLAEPERTVYGSVSADATSVDQLVEQTGLPVEQVLAGLSRLEAAGAIRRLSGVTVCRV